MSEYKVRAKMSLEGSRGLVSFLYFIVNAIIKFALIISLWVMGGVLFKFVDSSMFEDDDETVFDFVETGIIKYFKALVEKMNHTTAIIIMISLSVILLFLYIVLSIGLDNIYLKIAREEHITVSDIIVKDGKIGKAILLEIVTFLYIILWSLLFVIPGVVKAFAYSKAMYIYLDHPEYSIGECLYKSEKIMMGNKADNFVLELYFLPYWIIYAIVSKFTVLISGAVDAYGSTYFCVADAHFYLELIGQGPQYQNIPTKGIEEFKKKLNS